MNFTLTADYAISALSRGKRGTIGILCNPDGALEFVGFGSSAPVTKLWLVCRGSFWDECTFRHQLICRKGKGERIAWGVLTHENWNMLSASTDSECDLNCIAVVDSTKDDVDGNKIPLCLKIRFNKATAAVAAAWDAEICKLWIGEGQELRNCFSRPSDPLISTTSEMREESFEWKDRYGMN